MISIHQSQFMPWMPYFYKILSSDVFVQLDDVQFQKNGLQNRNQIKTPQGAQWLTVPVVQKLGTPINEVALSNPQKDIPKILKTISLNYQKSKYYNSIYEIFRFFEKHSVYKLFHLNNHIIKEVLTRLDFKGEVILSSSMEIIGKKDDLVIEIIRNMGEKDYLTGRGALDYMDLNKFKQNGISVFVIDFIYTEYKQLWAYKTGFIPDLSIFDFLFNNLEVAKEYITLNGNLKKIV